MSATRVDVKSLFEDEAKQIFKEVNFNDIFTKGITNDKEELYVVKQENIPKNIIGLDKRLKFNKMISFHNNTFIYLYNYNKDNWILRANIDSGNNKEESNIYFLINSIQNFINKDRQKLLFFVPFLLKILYIRDYNIIINKEFFTTDSIIYSKEQETSFTISLILSLIYIISSKIYVLQNMLKFNHNDLKVDNILWTARQSGYDFYFIDFATSRIELPETDTVLGDKISYGFKNYFQPGKDLYCLIHNILFQLKLNENEIVFNSLKNIFTEEFGLEINEDFLDFSKKSESPYYKEKYGHLQDYRDGLYPYYLSYLLNDYPEEYHADNIIEKINAYQSVHEVIDEKTFELGKMYRELNELSFNDIIGNTKEKSKRKYLINYK